MKEKYTEEIKKAMETISNYMENEHESYITREVSNIWCDIHDALERFAVIKGVIEEVEKEKSDIYEICCKEDKEFEDCYLEIEKIEDMFD